MDKANAQHHEIALHRQYNSRETNGLPLYFVRILLYINNPGEISLLTHWSRVTYICLSTEIIIGSDNGMSLGQAIIWAKAGTVLVRPLGTNFCGILIQYHTFSFKKKHLKMSSRKWRPFCLGLNVLKPRWGLMTHIVVNEVWLSTPPLEFQWRMANLGWRIYATIDQVIFRSDNGLSHQALFWTNTGVLLTHWGGDKMAAISQTTLPNPF